MTLNDRIATALERTGYKTYPNARNEITTPYFVFGWDMEGVVFGDDIPAFKKVVCWARFFCDFKMDSTKTVNDAAMYIMEAGFTYPITYNETDGVSQEWVFTFEDAEAIISG